MFCEKCGMQIADNAMFCNGCGARVEEMTAQNTAEKEIPTEQSPSFEASTEEAYGVSDFNMGEKPQRKKLPKKLVAIIAGAAVLTVGAFGLIFKDNIFFAVAPEKYTGNLLTNTLEQMSKEAEKGSENLIGFALETDDAYTVGANVEVKEDYEQGMDISVDYKLANDPSNKEMLLNMDVNGEQGDEKVDANVQGFWNDENIGIAVDNVNYNGKSVVPSELKNKYVVVPSKNFGDEFMNSIFADAINLGMALSDNDEVDISGLDLSYSNVMSLLKGEDLKPLKKEIKKEFLELLEESDISDRKSVKYRFDGDKVSAKKITVTFEAEDLVDFAIGVMEAAADDDFVREQLGDEVITYIELGTDTLKSARSDVPDYEFDVDLIEYDGRIVELSIVIEGDGFIISSTDKDHTLNGIKIEVVQNGSTASAVEFSSNWISESDDIFFNASVSENESVAAKASASFNFDSGKFKASVEVPGTDVKYSIGGKCSKSDGFSLTIDDIKIPQEGRAKTNSMDYDTWFNQEYRNGEKSYSYYNDNDNYDELWDIYYDEFWSDYNSYADWYDALGSNYDENYKTYDEWLDDELYNSEGNKQDYDYDTASYEWVDYDMIIKVTVSIKDSVDVEVKDRKYLDIFKMTEEAVNELGESFGKMMNVM